MYLYDLSFIDPCIIVKALLICILGKTASLREHGAWIKCEEVWKVKSHGLWLVKPDRIRFFTQAVSEIWPNLSNLPILRKTDIPSVHISQEGAYWSILSCSPTTLGVWHYH